MPSTFPTPEGRAESAPLRLVSENGWVTAGKTAPIPRFGADLKNRQDMTEQTQTLAPADDNSPLTIREAFAATRPPVIEKPEDEQDNGQAAPSEQDDESAAQHESAEETDAAAADKQPPGETEQADPDESPSIDPPRSWTAADKEAFKALPHETQQRIAERERAREVDFRKRQDEAARFAQAAQAEIQAAEQARKQYEEKLPHLAQIISNQMNAEFADIQSWDDVQKMAREDPARFTTWQAMREQQNAVQAEVTAAQARYRQEQARKVHEFYNAETEKFLEKAPEFADPAKTETLRRQAVETLQNLGFEPQEIERAWHTGDAIPVHDHRFQLLVRDATRYRMAQQTVKKAAEKAVDKTASKPAPQVQRPGAAVSAKDQRSERVIALDNKLTRTGSREAALALMRASRGS